MILMCVNAVVICNFTMPYRSTYFVSIDQALKLLQQE